MKLISQDLIDAIERERQRQEAKFPGQKLPATWAQSDDWSYYPMAPGMSSSIACEGAMVPTEDQAKRRCDIRPDWSRVLVEEVSEAVSAAGRGDAKHARQELIEVAAVALRWIEAIDRGECGL